MGLFSRKKTEQKPAVVKEAKQEIAKPAAKAAAPAGKPTGRQILVRPLLSEKGTHLAARGQYVFAVMKKANKPEIKKDIEKLYSVHVERVNIINMPGKTRRYGRTTGRTSDWRKAVVTLRAGEKIPGILEAVG